MTRITADWLESEETQLLFQHFATHNFQLLCVGGCVRNSLLDLPVSDIDMATNATPQDVLDIAETAGMKAIPTGIDHGTVTVLINDTPFEITTFRTDIETDGRHAKIAFSESFEEDAQRRDFTMNALYADEKGQVFDSVGGLRDLEDRKLRFIGNAADRITEDYLRILRFFRFYAWYGAPENGIDADGLAACAALADGLDTLSAERIGAEMRKLLAAADPAPALASMAQVGVLMRVMPGAEAGLLSVLVHLEAGYMPDWKRRALVLGGEDISNTWRLSREETRALELGCKDLHAQISVAEMGYRHGKDHALNVALVRAASLQRPLPDNFEDQIDLAVAAQFPINAADLMPQFEGPALGSKLRELEQLWITSGFQMTRDQLLHA